MKQFFLSLALVLAGGAALAQTVEAPKYKQGESWTYRVVNEKGPDRHEGHDEFIVSRVGADTIVVDVRTAGSAVAKSEVMFGADWSKLRSVNGVETVVNRPFAFPLEVGKSWKVEFTELNPSRQKLRQTVSLPYKVVGWEDVTVPAGTFKALKIEADGRWSADIAERNVGASRKTGGRIYRCFWYVPEVRRWVKSIQEDFTAEGRRNNRATSELERYGNSPKPVEKPTGAPAAPTIIDHDTL